MILVNYRGADDTITAVRELDQLSWDKSKLEVVIVDNHSEDDSAERIRAALPNTQLITSSSNLGFAGGCNLGAAHSTGEYLAFLNNDARPDRHWIEAAVDAFAADAKIGAVASRVLDWEGNLVDYIGAALTWFGMGYKPFVGSPISGRRTEAADVLFGTGAAMIVRSDVFRQLKGFDDRFFMFFEDVDFGWRLNLRGWRFRYVPQSLVYHRHHASMGKHGAHKETYLLERNALYALYKNLSDAALAEALPAALLLAVRRAVSRSGLSSESFDLRAGSNDQSTQTSVSNDALATIFGIDRLSSDLMELNASRQKIQSTRLVTDKELWQLFGNTDAPSFSDPHYLEGYEAITSTFDVLTAPDRPSVLIVTGDPLGKKMAGPAIRAWHIAQQLSSVANVRLVSMTRAEIKDSRFEVGYLPAHDQRKFSKSEKWADIIVFQGHAMDVFTDLYNTEKVVIADIYDPMTLEQLEQAKALGPVRWADAVGAATATMNEQLLRADFMICASEKQRDYYLGQLTALGRINTANYVGDESLRGLIDVVPFGLDAEPPVKTRAAIRGVIPGIEPGDKLVLWSGGLYDWFDPITLIRAIAVVSTSIPTVRLFFQGTKHPHPGVPEMSVVSETRALAEELGLLGKFVFFNESWVDYSDRANYLLEADLGISTHREHIETEFSFRTRILDYLWAGLPMVLSEGDHFAQLVVSEELGIAVPPGDVDALAGAIVIMLSDVGRRASATQNIARVRKSYEWARVLEPLVNYVVNAQRAGDAGDGVRARSRPVKLRRRRSYGLAYDIRRAREILVTAGPGVLVAKAKARLSQMARR